MNKDIDKIKVLEELSFEIKLEKAREEGRGTKDSVLTSSVAVINSFDFDTIASVEVVDGGDDE